MVNLRGDGVKKENPISGKRKQKEMKNSVWKKVNECKGASRAGGGNTKYNPYPAEVLINQKD